MTVATTAGIGRTRGTVVRFYWTSLFVWLLQLVFLGPCFDGSFRCWDPVHSDNCYLDTERCDGHFHCKQGADEKGCGEDNLLPF